MTLDVKKSNSSNVSIEKQDLSHCNQCNSIESAELRPIMKT
jgi:hypothetical protein